MSAERKKKPPIEVTQAWMADRLKKFSYDPLLTTAEAAEHLAMSPEPLLKLMRKGEIACIRTSQKKGSTCKFRLSALNKWLDEHTIPAKS